MGETLISIEGVSKKFCRNLKRSLWYGVKDVLGEITGRMPDRGGLELRDGEFWAVEDVSFEVKRGECVGLVGRNGAGKTTLLKMLNGLIKPDRGRIRMRGRVGALIALGAGFNPILTGRENVYVNGAVLGLSKGDIDKRFDEIVDFAEIEEFIDTPVQSYSSGMQVRLGFAVATAMEPDVLLLDEVLAVGDGAFRLKCFNRITAIQARTACIFVSHNAFDLMRATHRSVLLERGRLKLQGPTPQVLDQHNIDMHTGQTGFEFVSGRGNGLEFTATHEPLPGGSVRLRGRVRGNLPQREEGLILRMVLHDKPGASIAEWRSENSRQAFDAGPEPFELEFTCVANGLRDGTYYANFTIECSRTHEYLIARQRAVEFTVSGSGLVGMTAFQLPLEEFRIQ